MGERWAVAMQCDGVSEVSITSRQVLFDVPSMPVAHRSVSAVHLEQTAPCGPSSVLGFLLALFHTMSFCLLLAGPAFRRLSLYTHFASSSSQDMTFSNSSDASFFHWCTFDGGLSMMQLVQNHMSFCGDGRDYPHPSFDMPKAMTRAPAPSRTNIQSPVHTVL